MTTLICLGNLLLITNVFYLDYHLRNYYLLIDWIHNELNLCFHLLIHLLMGNNLHFINPLICFCLLVIYLVSFILICFVGFILVVVTFIHFLAFVFSLLVSLVWILVILLLCHLINYLNFCRFLHFDILVNISCYLRYLDSTAIFLFR